MRLGRQDGGVGEREGVSEKGGEGGSHKLPGPVSCNYVNDVLLTSAVAFNTLTLSDLDRYTHVYNMKGRLYTSTHM